MSFFANLLQQTQQSQQQPAAAPAPSVIQSIGGNTSTMPDGLSMAQRIRWASEHPQTPTYNYGEGASLASTFNKTPTYNYAGNTLQEQLANAMDWQNSSGTAWGALGYQRTLDEMAQSLNTKGITNLNQVGMQNRYGLQSIIDETDDYGAKTGRRYINQYVPGQEEMGKYYLTQGDVANIVKQTDASGVTSDYLEALLGRNLAVGDQSGLQGWTDRLKQNNQDFYSSYAGDGGTAFRFIPQDDGSVRINSYGTSSSDFTPQDLAGMLGVAGFAMGANALFGGLGGAGEVAGTLSANEAGLSKAALDGTNVFGANSIPGALDISSLSAAAPGAASADALSQITAGLGYAGPGATGAITNNPAAMAPSATPSAGGGVGLPGTSSGIGSVIQNILGGGGQNGANVNTQTGTGGLNLGGIAGLLSGVYGYNQQNNASNEMIDYLKQRQAINDTMYNPGSAEYNALWDEMSRKDAAAGRNSQYGPRSVDLASRVAQLKMDANTKMTTGIGNLMAASLNNRANAGANITSMIPGLLGVGGGTQNISSLIDGLGGLSGGSGGTTVTADDWDNLGDGLGDVIDDFSDWWS